jgi:hypothetical protein
MHQAQAQMLLALANLAQNQTSQLQNHTAIMQTQAALLARMAQTDTEIAESKREIAQLRRDFEETNQLNSERFERIEELLAELPEAVHRKFGFQPPPPPAD